MKAHSLQARLLLMVLGVVVVVWLGAAFIIWRDTRHELDELLDGHLTQAAALLVVQQSGEPEDQEHADAPDLHKYAPRVAFQVFHEDKLIMHSARTGLRPMADIRSGFATVQLEDGEEWRVFASPDAKRGVQIYVGERTASRGAILRAVLRSLLWPLFFALPLLALAVWWAVRRGLAPLHQLSDTLAQRRPEALEPVGLAGLPLEMQPLVRSLNALLDRIAGLLESERRFTADAAHELRTPIAAIRAQAQVALGAGDDETVRRRALQTTLAGCDRATHLVEQLLTLARLESAAPAPAARVDLADTARRVLADLAPVALARGQQLALEAPGPAIVTGPELLLGVLLRNLVDNALRYSPDGAAVRVELALAGQDVVLTVEDSGPGLAPDELARLGERFYRPPGQAQPGSGLGWSIVRRIAQVSGAQLALDRSPDLGGLRAAVRWPEAR